MVQFLDLLDGGKKELGKQGRQVSQKWKTGGGCIACPLDSADRPKIIGTDRIEGRPGMVWSLTPGRPEVEEGLELVGPNGRMLWEEIEAAGGSRDLFDTHHIVCCRPTTRVGATVKNRNPKDVELEACSHHTRRAVGASGGAASVYLLLGDKVADAVLGKQRKKTKPVQWSNKYQATMFSIDHPATFTRGGYPEWRLEEWREKLKAAVWLAKHPGRWAFLETADFKYVSKVSSTAKLMAKLRRFAAKGHRIAVDIEDSPKYGLLNVGFSWVRGKARTVILYHPENPNPQEADGCLSLIKDFLEDPEIEKSFHWGSSDVKGLRAEGIKVRGYTGDTHYSNFLRRTYMKSNGLEAISDKLYPLYAGYKEYIKPYLKSPIDYGDIPLQQIAKYNCADAALTYEIDADTTPHVNQDLLKVYVWAGMTLDGMQSRGPCLDERYMKAVRRIVPPAIEKSLNELRLFADKPAFRCTTEEVDDLLFRKLKLKRPDDSKGTDKKVLERMQHETPHRAVDLVLDWRMYSKMQSTYIDGYAESARIHGGQLRTKWALAGAVTGRLRSGGGKRNPGFVNMQNLHGKPFLKNLLVSDPDWYRVLDWKGGAIPEEIKDLDLFMAYDYSQVEIRFLAMVAQDELLIKQFMHAATQDEGDPASDIHCIVGHSINPEWSLEFIKSDKDTRTFIKNCHFGLVYGLSEGGLYNYLKVKGIKKTEEESREFHRGYFRTYKGVGRYIKYMRKFALEHGYVDTIFGFRRAIGDAADEERNTNPENQAVNSPIQGAAHQMILNAMALLHRKPKTFNLLRNPIMEVHDALVFRTKVRDMQECFKQGKYLMETAVPEFTHKTFGRKLEVPLAAEAEAGFRYATMVGDYRGTSTDKFLRDWLKYNMKVDADVRDEFGLAA